MHDKSRQKEDKSNYIQPTCFQHMPFNKYCEYHHYTPYHYHPHDCHIFTCYDHYPTIEKSYIYLKFFFLVRDFKYMTNRFWHIISMLWTLEWTMINVPKTNTMIFTKLIDKVSCCSINERCHMSYRLDTNYKHYYIIHAIHKSKLFVLEKNIIFQDAEFLYYR